MSSLLAAAARRWTRTAAVAATRTISPAPVAAAARFASSTPAAPKTPSKSVGQAIAGKHGAITSAGSVTGSHHSHSLNLAMASIGQTIEVPYDTTIGDSEQVMWRSTFQVHDRLFTSTPYAQSLNLPNHILPFYMILFKAISMGHVDEEREVLDIGFDNATYIRPAYPGDTIKQQFTIKHLKNTSNGKNTLVVVGCELFNQRQQLIFSVDKTMLFPNISAPASNLSAPPKTAPAPPRSHLLSHILYNSDNLSTTNNLAILTEGQLVLHSVSRPIGPAANMALSTLFRWTHPSIFNLRRYKDEELLVPGGLILAASISASSRGLFETLNESLESCVFLNKVSPVDLIGAVSYVQSIKNIKDGIEELKVITVSRRSN
jgi:2-methylfumaryl-CoA hydratase